MERIPINFTGGNILIYLAAHYNETKKVIRECVQNALDKSAKNIFVLINAKDRFIEVFDNGLGASKEELMLKFDKVGTSIKPTDKLGEKGIGNFAGIGIAKETELITRDTLDPKDTFKVYTIVKPELEGERQAHLYCEEFWAGRITSKAGFEVSAMVRLKKVDEKAFRPATIENIREELLDSFNDVLAKTKTVVQIQRINENGRPSKKETVEARYFRGSRIGIQKVSTRYGPVEFDLYQSQKSIDYPKITILHRNYGFALKNLLFKEQICEDIWIPWSKGYIEGSILVPFCKLTADRLTFEWDEQMSVFIDVLEQFTKSNIEPMVYKLEFEQKGQKYGRISELLGKKFTELFKDRPDLLPEPFRNLTKRDPNVEVDVKGGNALSDQGPDKSPRPEPPIPPKPRSLRPPVPPKHKTLYRGDFWDFVRPGPEEKRSWRSRLSEDNIVEINCLHLDFVRAETMGINKCGEYTFLLICKELAALSCSRSEDFSDVFEQRFMPYWAVNLK